MIKIDLVRKLSQQTNGTIKEAELFLDSTIEIISEALSRGEKAQLAGFGTWEVRKFNGRTGRNPKTGETLEIPDFYYPAFKAGKQLKERVSGVKIPVALATLDKRGEQQSTNVATSSKGVRKRSSKSTSG